MLTLHEVTKTYAARRVLDQLTLTIEAGESVALIGANGSGKTTTLRCVAGLARPDSGRIAIAGVDVAHGGGSARHRVSYLPQRPTFPMTLTVRETLAVVARLRHARAGAVERQIESCALAHVADSPVGQLSGGERQRLGMAVALLPDVDLYLFDEPSASLDPASLRILFERAGALTRAGRTLLFTTHVPADVRRLATRAVLLEGGRIRSEAAGASALQRFERMLGDFGWSESDEDEHRTDSGRADDRAEHGLRRAGAAA